jgi:hypothetical protein
MHGEFPLATPATLCEDASLGPDRFCMPTRRLETLLRDEPMKILLVARPYHGVTGPKRMALEFPEEGLVIRAKWKQAKSNAGGVNNNPRKELAAAALQKLFLDEDEYVVPPTVGRCVPLERYRAVVRQATPTFKDTGCVFGVFQYWVENVDELGRLDKVRFASDARYRDTVANMNLLTYLMAHADTRPSNFLLSKDREEPRAFSIDNGLAFGGLANPRTVFAHEWQRLVVPSVPHAKLERLRRIGRAELDSLAVVAQFEIHDRQLVPVAPTAPIDVNAGVRRRGDVIQLGLTRSEIDGVEKRLRTLIEASDAGKVKAY